MCYLAVREARINGVPLPGCCLCRAGTYPLLHEGRRASAGSLNYVRSCRIEGCCIPVSQSIRRCYRESTTVKHYL